MKIKNINKEIEEKTKSPESSKIDKLRIIKKTILKHWMKMAMRMMVTLNKI